MNKRVLLISGNYYPEPTGIGKYSGEMIDWLSENGFECTVITTFPYYPQWKVLPEYSRSRFWYKTESRLSGKNGSTPVTIIRCPHYIPTSPTGLKRLLSEFTISFFLYNALFFLFFSRKFDNVLTIAPPFELGILGVLYKKIRGGSFSYHIQDLQIDAAQELGMIKSTVTLKVFAALERFIIRNADHVSTISGGMKKKILEKCKREVIYFPNWVNTDVFRPLHAERGKIKEQYGFSAGDKIFLYSGAIGVKQGLEAILQVAKSLENLPHIKFVICGSGPYKVHLLKMKEDLHLENVVFMPLHACEEFNTFLNMADFHLVLQKLNAGDLVMPSKLSTIMAVGGVAIVTAKEGTSLWEIMRSSDMGILIEPENYLVLKNAIEYAVGIDPSGKASNARAYAENHFAFDKVLAKFSLEVLDREKLLNQEGLLAEEIMLSR